MSLFPSSVPAMQVRADTTSDGTPDGWKGGSGWAWMQRNPKSVQELDWGYEARYGFTRTSVYRDFLTTIPRQSKVLEVGCSYGLQLRIMDSLGFRDLSGCDLHPKVVAECPYNAIVASGMDLPYANESFDMVFTSGTLMHVPLPDRNAFCRELLRVSRRWIFGFELYDDPPREWEFGSLMPKAWGTPEPQSFVQTGLVRVVRKQVHASNRTPMKYVSYLLEKL